MDLNQIIKKSYAGSILIDIDSNIKYKFIRNPLIKPFYEHFWRHYIIGYSTMFISRDKMRKQGVLHWDVGMKSDDLFIIYSIKTKKASSLRIFRTLLNETENIAKTKEFEKIIGYSQVFSPDFARRYKWDVQRIYSGFRFTKKLI